MYYNRDYYHLSALINSFNALFFSFNWHTHNVHLQCTKPVEYCGVLLMAWMSYSCHDCHYYSMASIVKGGAQWPRRRKLESLFTQLAGFQLNLDYGISTTLVCRTSGLLLESSKASVYMLHES